MKETSETIRQRALNCNGGDFAKARAWLERDLERQENELKEERDKLTAKGARANELPTTPTSIKALHQALSGWNYA